MTRVSPTTMARSRVCIAADVEHRPGVQATSSPVASSTRCGNRGDVQEHVQAGQHGAMRKHDRLGAPSVPEVKTSAAGASSSWSAASAGRTTGAESAGISQLQRAIAASAGRFPVARASARTSAGSTALRQSASSCGPHQALPSTGTAPMLTVAQKLMIHSGLLKPSSRIRSPRPVPVSASSAALASAVRRSCREAEHGVALHDVRALPPPVGQIEQAGHVRRGRSR